MEPFRIAVPQPVLDDLAGRLARFRPVPSPEAHGWEDGTDLAYLAELVGYWRDRFDWRAQEARWNRLPQFRAEVKGAKLHVIHQRGVGPAPMPLLLAHGWPDSVFRFEKLIPLLTDPAAHGGDPADAFDIVAPGLPGYGWSDRPPHGADDAHFGGRFHALMTMLGYERYGAHGGDIGSRVLDQLGRHHPDALLGLHFTDVPMTHAQHPPRDLSGAEQRYLAEVEAFKQQGGGYMHIQGTKPWTPAAALNDSPAGLAAWIVEKFQAWSDCGGNVESRFSKDELLSNVMLYWATQTIGTSFLAYRDSLKPGLVRAGLDRVAGVLAPIAPPAGFALFPKDIATAPRSWAERFYDVRRWSEMPAGGHFAALEEPEALANELRAFFRPLRLPISRA